MKRKVIQIADSTQLVSLPRKWCQEQGIKKGDELEVEIQGNKILINSSGRSETLRETLKMLDSKHFLRRPIDVLYRLGYDEIEIHFRDAGIIDLIQNEIEGLLGFEIVNQTDHSCVIRNVASGMDTEFDNILRRIMLMLISMSQDTHTAIINRNFENLDEIQKREKTNNKLTIFCERLLNKKGYKDHRKQAAIYNYVCHLEYLADIYRDLCLYVKNNNVKVSKESAELIQKVHTMVEMVYKLFYKFDFEMLFKFKKQQIEIKKKAFELLKKPKQNPAVLHYLLNLTERLRHMTEIVL